MAEKIEIDIVANNQASGVLFNLKGSFTELNSALGLVHSGLRMLNDAYDATVGKTMEYAQDVRDLMLISGQNTEETSRFIQVLDDYQLTADDAATATRKLTQEGLAPNIETIAKLSDEYLALSDAQAKNDLILKNLGRSGLQWVNLLNQGGDAIRANAAAVNEALILGDKQLEQAEELRLNQDAFNDSLKGVATTIGNTLIPAMNALFDGAEDNTRALEIMMAATEGMNYWQRQMYINTKANQEAAHEQARLERELADATRLRGDEVMRTTQITEEMIKAQNAANLSLEKSMITVQGELDNFADANENLEERQADLLDQIDKLRTEGYAELAEEMDKLKAKGEEEARIAELREEGLKKLDEEMVDLQREYANTGEAITTLADKHDEAMKRIVFDLLMAKMEADGLTGAEFNIAIAAGEALGVIDKTTADMAKAFDELATKLAGGTAFQASGAAAMFSAVMGGETLTPFTVLPGGSKGPGPGVMRDFGGAGMAGEAYAIGRGAQPEVFVPGEDGWFFPNAGGGGSTINVYNSITYAPTLSTASRAEVEQLMPLIDEGTRRTLRNLGISGR